MLATNDRDFINPDDWPSIDLAYEFVRPSYEALARRIESAEGRVGRILTFAATLTFAVPAFATVALGDNKPHFTAPSFALAVIAFIVIASLGLTSTLPGEVRVVHPRKLYETWLGLPQYEFKRRAIWLAGEDFQKNSQHANRVANVANGMALVLVVEVVLFALWILLR